MATNDFLTFAGDPAANAMTQTQYADTAFTARILGFATGTALSLQLNKVWRQASIISHMIGQFTVDEINQDMLDDGTPGGVAALESHFRLAITHVAQSAVGTGYLPLVGGTLTGPLTINSANALSINAPINQSATFSLQRQAGQTVQIAGFTGPNARWAMELADNAPEQGGNTGSNFDLISFNDAGQYLETPLSINRATGVVNFAHNPTVNGTALPYVRLTGDIMSGTLGVGGTGISYNGLGGYWAQHHIAFGWDGNLELAVDGTGIGAIALQGWALGLFGQYLPLTGGILTGVLDIRSNLYVSGFTWNRSTVYFSNLGDFANFYDGRYRFRQWAGSWFDAWDGNTGLRIWAAPNAWIMTLDGSGNLAMNGGLHVNGGRILSVLGGAPSVCAWSTGGSVATGFWTDGSGMWLGNMDGAGNPTDWHMLIGNDGYFQLRSSGQCNGSLWVAGQITANSNLYVVGTSTLSGYVHVGGAGIQNDGPLTNNGSGWFGGGLRANADFSCGGQGYFDNNVNAGGFYGNYVHSNGDINADGHIHASWRIIAIGGTPSFTCYSPGNNNAMGFWADTQMNFGHTDGEGGPGATLFAVSDNAFVIRADIRLFYNPNASDASLKTNIQPAPSFDSLGAIVRVPIISFDWIKDGRHVSHGITVQSLEDVLPDAVEECPIEPAKGLKFIDQQAVVAHLFRAIGQLNDRIAYLERLVS